MTDRTEPLVRNVAPGESDGVPNRAPSSGCVATGCRLCAGATRHAFTAREMMLGTRDEFGYERCEDCGALQIAAVPEDLDRYYPDGPDGYYTRQQSRVTSGPSSSRALRRHWSRIRLGDAAWIRLFSGRRFARFDWFRRTGVDLDAAILDVGCGGGRLLARMAREGFSNLTGIDPRCPHQGGGRPGLTLRCERPEDHVGRYALVMAHHSFEHMADPLAGFEAMARLIERDGYLLLRVPVADGWASGHFGPDWAQLDAPRHLQIPTRESIRRLASRNGLRIERIEDDSGPFQIWGSLAYQRGVSLADAGRGGRHALSLPRRLRARWQARRLSRAGLGDQASFYLRNA